MEQKRAWSFAGLLVIALVVSMPFYVADVHAVSVSITKNQGSGGIEEFIDADGDVWTVEATISGHDGAVEAENVKLTVGANEAEFNTCSSSEMETTCTYVSPLNDGVTERTYNFDVLFSFLDTFMVEQTVGDSDAITADGSGPEIKFNRVWQDGGEVKLDFSVEDKPEMCVGLEKVEILDAESDTVLQTIETFSEKDCDFDFSETGGVLATSLEGEGRKSIQIKARDRLGHETSKVKSFAADFMAPVIDNEIRFIDFGEFIGQYNSDTAIEVNVTEEGSFLRAKAYSDQAELDGDEVDCQFGSGDMWTCRWENVEVNPASSVSVRVVAEDDAGNMAEKTLSKSFVVDSYSPEAVVFETERTYEDVSYVSGKSSVENRVVLEVREEGVGIDSKGIKANLAAIGGGSFDSPDSFDEETGEGYWDVDYSSSSKEVLIGLSYFKDKVGNEGHKPSVEVVVDNSGPQVVDAEIFGWSDAGKKGYFQSDDILSIELEVVENSGLFILVNLNDAVMDAETKFSEEYHEVGEAGWQAFTEEDCSLEDGKWVCVLETTDVKSGPDSSVNLEILVMDTAGNVASWLAEPENIKSGSNGKYKFELLGVLDEEEPDYWEVSSVKPLGGEGDFIDMDTTELISTRMAMKVGLQTDSNAKAVKIDLIGCEPESGFGSNQREVLFDNLAGRTSENPEPVLILEFSPDFDSRSYFDVTESVEAFKGAELEYTCYMNVYSQLGKKAVKNAEVQEVTVQIPFAFTDLGSKDENLDDKIKAAKSGYYDATAWLGTLAEILDWAKYIANIA
ncbi:hypothetical protein GOV03_00925, partial [Candidatus Woesearchaeota archaeon]|nr:hypothetical protein [Candidatus Woesearchaeota archaeon]